MWVKVLVWILVGGLVLASVVGVFAIAIHGWTQPAQQPVTITADDLPPEILEQLQQQMDEQGITAENQAESNVDDSAGANQNPDDPVIEDAVPPSE